jgi:hypothetical protein
MAATSRAIRVSMSVRSRPNRICVCEVVSLRPVNDLIDGFRLLEHARGVAPPGSRAARPDRFAPYFIYPRSL